MSTSGETRPPNRRTWFVGRCIFRRIMTIVASMQHDPMAMLHERNQSPAPPLLPARRALPVQRNVQPANRVRQGAGADSLDSGKRDLANRLQRYPA
jgi:hypothetical protein